MAYSYTLEERTLNGLKNELQGKKKILITTHKSPDGDAVGSSLGLYHFLQSLGHEVYVSLPDPAPAFLHWMPGFEDVIIYKNNQEAFTEVLNECDVLFALDYNHFSRTGEELGKLLSESDNVKIMIDHHQEPDSFMKYMVWDVNASSTAQLVFDMIVALQGEKAVSKEIGDCLYTGIMTDTGSFRFASCTSHTMQIVSYLISVGVDGNKIHQLVYDQNSIDRLRLMGYALEKMVLLKKYHTAYITLSSKELRKFNYQAGDTEGLVNKALSVKGVKVAALLTEKEGSIRFSLRSSADFSVNDFARKYFNGGGHYHAAGGSLNATMEEATNLFEKYIKASKNELESA
jgi:phosphoesterase RecJ-like protein